MSGPNHLIKPKQLTPLTVSPRDNPADRAVNVTEQVAAKAKAKADKDLAILQEMLINGNLTEEQYDKMKELIISKLGKSGGYNRKRSKKYKNQKRTRSRRRFRRGTRRRYRH
jgi:secreted Zn-dependent insulinase-like peptidase